MLDGKLDDWKYDVVSVGFPRRSGTAAFLPTQKISVKAGRDSISKSLRQTGACHQRRRHASARQLSRRANAIHRTRDWFGSALVWNGIVLSLELSELPYLAKGTIEDRVGKTGLKQIGRKNWEEDVERILTQLQRAFVVDYIVLGGATRSYSSTCHPEWNLVTIATPISAASASGKIIPTPAAQSGRFCEKIKGKRKRTARASHSSSSS